MLHLPLVGLLLVLRPPPRGVLSEPRERPCGALPGPGDTRAPCRPQLPLTLGVVALNARLPELLTRPMTLHARALIVALLYEAVEFMLDRFAAAYIHLTRLLPLRHCPRTHEPA